MVSTHLVYLLWGGTIGILSGMIGVGGGVFVIPILVWLFKLSQHQAQGTSLAMMVPPIGLLAAWRYHQAGNVVMPIALCGALGFVLEGLWGADLAQRCDATTLSRLFGTALIPAGLRMVLR